MSSESTKKLERRGFMLVLSSPSGAGKTTIAKHVLEQMDQIEISVSATTRPKRPAETEGKDYFFTDKETFEKRKKNGVFLEWANVFGHIYGTPKAAVFEKINNGMDVLFDIEWQGTQQLKQKAHQDVVSIFILPPSTEELEKRLISRAQDSLDVVSKRMQKATNEISHWAEYDYIIVNYDIEHSVQQVISILTAERLKRERQTGLVDFVKGLMKVD